MLVNFCLFPGNCVAMLASITRVLFKHDKRTARETPGQSAYVVRSYCYRRYVRTVGHQWEPGRRMVGNFTSDNGDSHGGWGFSGVFRSIVLRPTNHQKESAMTKTLPQRVREVAAIPEQLERVSRDITGILVAAILLSLLAVTLATVAIGVASRGN